MARNNSPDIHRFETGMGVIRYIPGKNTSDKVFFLGLGQNGRNLAAVALHAPPDTAVVEAFPFHLFPKDEISGKSVKHVEQILDELNHEPVDVLAESQAAPLVIEAAAQSPYRFHSLTLLGPLGFNYDALGMTPQARLSALLKRSNQFWRHRNQRLSLSGNRETLANVAKNAVKGSRRLKSDYMFGANQDVSSKAIKLAERLPVTIYADQEDSLFPYDEIKQSVEGSNITLVETKYGSHLNRATPLGRAAFQFAIEGLNESIRQIVDAEPSDEI